MQNPCTESLDKAPVQNPCTEFLCRVLVKGSCTESLYRQYYCNTVTIVSHYYNTRIALLFEWRCNTMTELLQKYNKTYLHYGYSSITTPVFPDCCSTITISTYDYNTATTDLQ